MSDGGGGWISGPMEPKQLSRSLWHKTQWRCVAGRTVHPCNGEPESSLRRHAGTPWGSAGIAGDADETGCHKYLRGEGAKCGVVGDPHNYRNATCLCAKYLSSPRIRGDEVFDFNLCILYRSVWHFYVGDKRENLLGLLYACNVVFGQRWGTKDFDKESSIYDPKCMP